MKGLHRALGKFAHFKYGTILVEYVYAPIGRRLLFRMSYTVSLQLALRFPMSDINVLQKMFRISYSVLGPSLILALN